MTGIGLVTPLGVGREECWRKIRGGVSPIPVTALPQDSAESFRYARFSPLPDVNGLPRVFYLSDLAVDEALTDSGINLSSIPSDRVGCSLSVSKPIFLKGMSRPISPESVSQTVRKKLRIDGPAENSVAACATGTVSIGKASRWLKEGLCDLAIAGSADSSLHPLYLSGFERMGVLSEDPCPFDRRRQGFLIGEGSGVLILERKKDALARAASIYAQVSGCFLGSDAHNPTSFAEDGSSIARVLEKAVTRLSSCGHSLDDMNCHGTGTVHNDRVETRAIKKVLGTSAYSLSLSSTKASTGHLLGAAASVEAAVCCLALRDNFVPPTAHLESPDPECDLDYTPQSGKEKKIRSAVSLSFGFGGSIGIIAFVKQGS